VFKLGVAVHAVPFQVSEADDAAAINPPKAKAAV